MTNPHHFHPVEQLPPTRLQGLLKIATSYYAIALVIAGAFTYLFGWLADEVAENEFSDINRSILLNIHSHLSPTLTTLALTITWLGSTWGVVTIGGLLAVALIVLRRYVDLATFASVLIGASVMVMTLKLLFHQ